MANGDISNLAVLANGAGVSFDVAGMNYATVSGFQAGKAATLACTSEAYSGTTLGTAARTGIRTAFRSAVVAGTTTVSDTFTEGSTTSLDAHAPDTDVSTAGWTEVAGDWQVASNLANLAANNAGSITTIDGGGANGTATCDIRVSVGFSFGFLIFRYVDANNFWFVKLSNGGTDDIRLYKKVAGTDTQVGDTAIITVSSANFYTVTATTSGNSISVTFAGTQVITASDSAHNTATKYGIGASATTTFFNNFGFTQTTGSIITLDLSEPLHNDDTSITMTMDAGAFSDGSVSSAALSGTAVSNASNTNDYPVPVAIVASLPLTSRKTTSFYVDVYACGGSYNGLRSPLGIAAVTVTVTDSAAAAKTLSATSMTLVDRIGEHGWKEKIPLFRVGPFNPSDWDGSGTDCAAGLATVVAKAYPKVGDADSIRTSRTEYEYLDPADDYVTTTTTISSGGDIHAAIKTVENAGGKSSWSTVYLNEGSYQLGTYSFGSRSNTSDGPVIITRAPGAAKENVIITGSATTDGVRTTAIFLDDITIDTDVSGPISTGAAAAGSGALYDAGNWLIARNLRMIGPGRTDDSFTDWASGFERAYYAGCYYSDAKTGPILGVALVRDCKCDSIGQDFSDLKNNTAYFNNDISLNQSGTAFHAGVLQFSDGSTWTNTAFHQNIVRGGGQYACAPTGYFNTSGGITSFAMTLNVQEANADTPNNPTQLDDCVLQSLFWYHNDWADVFLLSEADDRFSANNVFIQRNYFTLLSEYGTPNITGICFDDNHNAGGDILDGVDWTTGGSTATLFDDWANDDYGPAGSLLNRATESIIPFDTEGLGYFGAIGAQGDAPTLTATPSGLTVTLTSDTPTGATDYVVYASDDGVDFTLIEGIVISGAISYEYSNAPGNPFQMVAGGTYYFKLKYMADEVELGYSTTASATLTAGGGFRNRKIGFNRNRHMGRIT